MYKSSKTAFGKESSDSLDSSSGLLCNHVGLWVLCRQNTLETCTICSKPIMERILRATGKAYHPHCFTCVVCHRSLDGIPFTVDASNHIHCIEDFHKYVVGDFIGSRSQYVGDNAGSNDLI